MLRQSKTRGRFGVIREALWGRFGVEKAALPGALWGRFGAEKAALFTPVLTTLSHPTH
jgi:hypothetical protein